MDQAKWYGVSSGDGNNGVSHMFADYYVKTNEPWRLAELAALTEFKPGEGQAWAKENMQIDGEAEYTISATFMESPETQNERDEMQARLDSLYVERDELGSISDIDLAIEELEKEIENYGADYCWLIIEVSPVEDDDMREGRPTFESLQEAFGEVLELVPAA